MRTYSIDILLRDFISPLVQKSGFKRTGRSYTLQAVKGSVVRVAFRRHDSNATESGFLCDWAVTPVALRDFYERDGRRASSSDLMWGVLAEMMPTSGGWGPESGNVWSFTIDDGGLEKCGQYLHDQFADLWIPHWLRLAEDYGYLQFELENARWNLPSKYWRPPFSTLFLRIDTDPPAALRSLLQQAAEKSPDDDALPWLGRRLESREGPGGSCPS